MILSIDQSLSKIGYSIIKIENELMKDIKDYNISFEEYLCSIHLKESQIIKVVKKNKELTLNVILDNIKWTIKQQEEIKRTYFNLNLKSLNINMKYNHKKSINSSFRAKQIRNVVDKKTIDYELKEIGILTTKTKGMERLSNYINEIKSLINKYNPELIIIEGYSYGSSNTRSVFELGELAGSIKLLSYEMKTPILIVPPSSLKLFITDDGKAQKDKMMDSIKDKFGEEFYYKDKLSDDMADSFGLGIFGIMFPFMDIDFQIKSKMLINKG